MSSPTERPRSAWFESVLEHGHWKTWLDSMTPERLEQQRAYDRERGRKYHQERKEDHNKKRQERYQQNKERLCEKHVCETCGGQYTTSKKAQHFKTKHHQAALANVSPTSFKCDVCGGQYTQENKARHKTSKKHLAAEALLHADA